MIDLIYCASGNEQIARIAIDAGFHYGAQLPGTVYYRPYFADQNWKDPDRERYMAALAEYRPHMASVLDWEWPDQLPEVLAWAEDAAQYVEVVMIIPKVQAGVSQLPRSIGGRPVRLGYSVPTKHGGTELPAWEFAGWPVHLLGGSPGAQMCLAHYMNVRSADGNMALGMATGQRSRGGVCFWEPGTRPFANRWLSLEQADGERWSGNGPQEAFRRSCANIMRAWKRYGFTVTPCPATSAAMPPGCPVTAVAGGGRGEAPM